jgi:uncharacterized protein YecE (DUF72 family)
MAVFVGTSGWQYRDWRGALYPSDLGQGGWLEYYAARFGTVENNGSFYRLPGTETFARWRIRTPAGFVMAIKASRYLTHIRRLRDSAEPVDRLMRVAVGLGDRLGPVLLQLPPTLPADPAALDECLTEFGRYRQPADGEGGPGPGAPVRVAVECRHESWWTDDIKDLLTRHNAALCWADQLGEPLTPLWRTADWAYLRFHQGAAEPCPTYDQQVLDTWLRRLDTTWPGEADMFVYFNNDQEGAAPHDASAFATLAQRAGHSVPGYKPG